MSVCVCVSAPLSFSFHATLSRVSRSVSRSTKYERSLRDTYAWNQIVVKIARFGHRSRITWEELATLSTIAKRTRRDFTPSRLQRGATGTPLAPAVNHNYERAGINFNCYQLERVSFLRERKASGWNVELNVISVSSRAREEERQQRTSL